MKHYGLDKFKGADDTVRLTIRLSIGYCILLTAAFVSCIIYLTVKIEKAYSQALVIDKNGEVYETSSLPAGSMRKYEYLNHVKPSLPTGMHSMKARMKATYPLR